MMIGRLIGAAATSMVARKIGGTAAGPAGAVIGMALPMVARRLGPLGMAAMAVGAWAVTRQMKAPADTSAVPGIDPVQIRDRRSPAKF